MGRSKKDLPVDPNNMTDQVAKVYPPLPGSRKQGPNVGVYGPTSQNKGFGRTGSPSIKGYGSVPFGPKPAPVDLADQDKFRTVGLNRGNIVDDTMGGMTIDDMLAYILGDGGNVDGSGGSGSSRGGGGYNPDPLNWAGINNYQNVQNAYQQMLDAQAQGAAAVSSGFDARQKALDDMVRAETERNAGIQAGLLSAAGAARQQIGESYSQGARSLQDLATQYGQMIAGRQPAAEQTLQAFGAGGAVSSPQQVQDMLVAQQAALARQGQSYDALLAGRPEMYSALNAEQEQVRARQADLVRAQLLAARQQADAQAARERAQLALQMQQALLAAQP